MRRAGGHTLTIGALLSQPHEVARALRGGRRLRFEVPASELPRFGFVRELGVVERAGQREDWTRELPDGSRLHAHVMPDGRVMLHRDRWSPRRGPLHAVAHVATETTVGRMLVGAVVGRVLGWIP